MKTTPYAKLLRYLRDDRQLSQVEIAKRLSLSRASYLALESGRRELTLKEALAVTSLYNITIDQLMENTKPDLVKFREMIRFILRSAAKEKSVIKKTKLSQILYLVDMRSYYDTKNSLSGMMYRKYAFGPASDAYFRLIEEMESQGEINIIQVRREDYHMYEIRETRGGQRIKISSLTPKEVSRIEAVFTAWRDASTAEITAFVTAQSAYRNTLAGDIIDYKLILREEPHLVS